MHIPDVSMTSTLFQGEPKSSYKVLNKLALEKRTQEIANNTLNHICDGHCDGSCDGPVD